MVKIETKANVKDQNCNNVHILQYILNIDFITFVPLSFVNDIVILGLMMLL